MEKKLFITDLDGTLLTDEKNFNPIDLETLSHLRSNDVVTVIATGRSVFSFNRAMSSLGIDPCKDLDIDYLIFSTGAGIMDLTDGRIIFKQLISPAEASKAIQYLTQKKFDFMVLNAIPDVHHFKYRSFGHKNPDFQRRIDLYHQFATPITLNSSSNKPVTEILVITPENEGEEKISQIRKELNGFSIIHATSPLDHSSYWIEIFHPGVSKSKTAEVLATKLGINKPGIYSVGNDFNDQDLLEWSGQGYIVTNGPRELKEKYTIVSSNNQAGVTDAAISAGLITPARVSGK